MIWICCVGKAVEVFDTEQVTFYFCNNMEDRGLFFNVLCLEETGMEMSLCVCVCVCVCVRVRACVCVCVCVCVLVIY